MATDNLIKIKRSTGTTAPVATTDIAIGELAVAQDSSNNGVASKVYLGHQNASAGNTVLPIGGRYYTKAVEDLAYFKTIVVAGQSNIVADTSISGSTLTVVAGSGITLTTNAATDTLTIAAPTAGGGTVTSITPAAGNGSGTAITSSGTITVTGTLSEIETSVSGTTITVGLPDNVKVDGNLTVQGNLIVNGSTTTVNSTITTVDDPIFTLGGDSAPLSDDNKDRGIEFRWHNGTTAKVGFFGFDDSTGYFTFIPDATNTSEVFSGSVGTLQVAGIRGATNNISVPIVGPGTANAQLDVSGAATAGATKVSVGAKTLELAGDALGSDGQIKFIFDPLGGTSGPVQGLLVNAVLTGARTWTLPNATGTVVTTGNLTDITAVGTVTSGAWQSSTLIAGQYGGTGVNNAGKTLTLGGNFTHTGAHTLGLTTTANTSVTLPTTGTLATLSGTETLSSKTIALGSNTVSGTLAQFNTALTDGDFVSLTGTETLQNKTITSGTFDGAGGTISGTLTAGAAGVLEFKGGATLSIPTGAGKTVVSNGQIAFDSTAGDFLFYDNKDTTTRIVVSTAKTQTLTNKTLTTPIIASILTNSGAATVTLPTLTSTLATLALTESLTNKTLSTGSTWQGNLIGSTYGGTGVNNGSYTITLGGNISTAGSFTTSGAFALTLTASNTTNATFPAGTITLVDLSTSQTLSNKTIDGGTF